MTINFRKAYPGFWNAVLLCVTFVVLQILLTVPFGVLDAIRHRNLLSNPVVFGMVNILACSLVLLMGAQVGRRPMSEICSLRRVGRRVVLAVIVSTGGVAILLAQANNLLQAALPPPEWAVRFLVSLFSSQHPGASFCLVVIVAPVTEELIFRGLILRGLLQRFSPPRAILLSSILFSAVHLNPWQFPAAMFLGLMLGFWYARTRSLVPCLIGHALANGLAFGCVFLLLKVRGFNVAELGRTQFLPAWFVAIGLLLLVTGTWLFLRAAPAIKNNLAPSSELSPPAPSDSEAPPIILPAAAQPSEEACALRGRTRSDVGNNLELNAPGKRRATPITSFVLGMLSVTCLGLFAGVPAIILGHKARREAKKAPEQYKGGGLALAGMILGCVSVIPTLFVAWVTATMLFPGSANLFIAPVQSTGCVSNLNRIGLGFRSWARGHGGRFPMSTLTLEDGASADVVADQGLQVFRQLGAELLNPGWLVCPADPSRHRAVDFQKLQATNISYRLEIGPETNEKNPHNPLARCPIHGHELLCDGSVRTNDKHLPRQGHR
jgi:uncharacterized protein